MQSPWLNISPPLAVLVGAVTMFVAVAASMMIVTRANDGDVVIISDPTQFEIVVEVRGAVKTPGVYRLSQDARLGDLLTAAGGANSDADLAPHNLARRLNDAEVVIIGRIGGATPISLAAVGGPTPTPSSTSKVDVNTATKAELEALPGIGPVLAQRIIDDRMANGRFNSAADLTRVEGISDGLVAEIRDLITTVP